MASVLVTGAAGFIGSHLVQRLAAEGYRVRASDVQGSDLSIAHRAGAEVFPADIFDVDAMRTALTGIEYVIHAAALFDLGAPRHLLEKINVRGVETLCRLSLEKKVRRFVLVSTSAIYGKPARVPIMEDDPKRPLEAYGKTKWEGEKAAFLFHERYGLPVTAVRPTLVYGPRSRYGHALYIAGAVLLKQSGVLGLHMLDGGPLSHHVHVSDVCRAITYVLGSDDAAGKAFNVADDGPVTLEGFLRAIIEPFGISVRKRVRYYPVLWRSCIHVVSCLLPLIVGRLNRRIARVWRTMTRTFGLVPALSPRVDRTWLRFVLYDQYYDTSRLRALGWRPQYVDFNQGIRETIEWYVTNRWIPCSTRSS